MNQCSLCSRLFQNLTRREQNWEGVRKIRSRWGGDPLPPTSPQFFAHPRRAPSLSRFFARLFDLRLEKERKRLLRRLESIIPANMYLISLLVLVGLPTDVNFLTMTYFSSSGCKTIVFPQHGQTALHFGSFISHSPDNYFAKLAILTNSKQDRGSVVRIVLVSLRIEDCSIEEMPD